MIDENLSLPFPHGMMLSVCKKGTNLMSLPKDVIGQEGVISGCVHWWVCLICGSVSIMPLCLCLCGVKSPGNVWMPGIGSSKQPDVNLSAIQLCFCTLFSFIPFIILLYCIIQQNIDVMGHAAPCQCIASEYHTDAIHRHARQNLSAAASTLT